MISIRKSIFETNSSSSHSITIGRNEKGWIKVKKVDTITISPGEFGWGPEQHTDFYTKASYALTWAKTYSNDPVSCLEMLENVIKNETGCKEVAFKNNKGDFWPDGYIDHQSTDVCEEVFEDEETLRAFLFNRSSVLVISNDNMY